MVGRASDPHTLGGGDKGEEVPDPPVVEVLRLGGGEGAPRRPPAPSACPNAPGQIDAGLEHWIHAKSDGERLRGEGQ